MGDRALDYTVQAVSLGVGLAAGVARAAQANLARSAVRNFADDGFRNIARSSGASVATDGFRAFRRSPGASAPRTVPLTVLNKCFVAGTPVLMADGSTKFIEDVEEGDWVLADDPEDGRAPMAREVTAWHLNWTEHLTEVSVDRNGDLAADGSLQATREHPFGRRPYPSTKHLLRHRCLPSQGETRCLHGCEGI